MERETKREERGGEGEEKKIREGERKRDIRERGRTWGERDFHFQF